MYTFYVFILSFNFLASIPLVNLVTWFPFGFLLHLLWMRTFDGASVTGFLQVVWPSCQPTVGVNVSCENVLRGPAVEHRSLAGVLLLSCVQLVADG